MCSWRYLRSVLGLCPQKAAHFRVWLPRKKLAVTQSTCGNDTFCYCGAVRHHCARGRAHGRAILVANTSGTAYRSNREDSTTAVRAGIAARLLGIFPSRTTLLMQTTLARASEVRGRRCSKCNAGMVLSRRVHVMAPLSH